MDFSSLATDTVKGAAMGATFGPIGALAGGLLLGAVPDLIGAFIPHLAPGAAQGAEVAQAVVSTVAAVTGNAVPSVADVQALPPDRAADLRNQLAQIATQAEANRLAAAARERQDYLADVQNARARDLQMETGGKRNVRADIMLGVVGVGLVVCIGAVALGGNTLTGEAIGLISTVAGTFGACLKDAFGFEFGSSRSSENKTAIMAKLLAEPRMAAGLSPLLPFQGTAEDGQ